MAERGKFMECANKKNPPKANEALQLSVFQFPFAIICLGGTGENKRANEKKSR